MDLKKILSIDVGILNLGYVYCVLTQTGIELLDCGKIDITIMRHCNTLFSDCKLHHDNCIPDYLEHFFQEYNQMFDNAEVILVERQPITGITNVQDLILNKYRERVVLVSPNKIHKYFGMSRDYLIRKRESQRLSESLLNKSEYYNNLLRKHDISDAMLMIIMYYNEFIKPKPVIDRNVDFEQFRFIKSK